MLIITKGKNVEVTPELRATAQRKVARLARYAPGVRTVEVEFSVEHTKSVVDREIVQLTLELDGNVLRAEERAADVQVALDAAVDQLRNQLIAYHSRERTRVRGRSPADRTVVARGGPTGGEYGKVIPPETTEPPAEVP